MANIDALAKHMRAVGAGRASLDGLSLDLTVAPLPVAAEPGAKLAAVEPPTQDELRARRDAVLFRSTGGVRVKLR